MMSLYKKRSHSAFCLLLAIMVLLVGCGVENQKTNLEASQEAEQEQIPRNRPGRLWTGTSCS